MPLPPWAGTLANLYWHLRACRHCSRPSSRTWHRRIAAEKRRLWRGGVDPILLHTVCRHLRRPWDAGVRERLARLLGLDCA